MLPKTVDPEKLSKHGSALQGDLALHTLPRLQEIADQAGQVAQVSLQFAVESRVTVIRGEIDAVVNLICQRCNTVMTHPVRHSFALSPVSSDAQAKRLSDAYEPIVMQNELVSVAEMIEEELLLALPMVPKHEACSHPISC